MLIFDVIAAMYDTGMATYNFIQGRWIAGVILVAIAGLVMWAASGLLEAKHGTAMMQMRHEYMMNVLEKMNKRMEYVEEDSDGEESQLQEALETADR